MKLKYIVFDNAFPVVFGEYFTHADVARRLQRIAGEFADGEVTGAGFVYPAADDSWKTYGRSESLDIAPGKQDDLILTKLLNNSDY